MLSDDLLAPFLEPFGLPRDFRPEASFGSADTAESRLVKLSRALLDGDTSIGTGEAVSSFSGSTHSSGSTIPANIFSNSVSTSIKAFFTSGFESATVFLSC